MEKNILPKIDSNRRLNASNHSTPKTMKEQGPKPQFKQAYEQVDVAKTMINNRMDKLKYELELLKNVNANPLHNRFLLGKKNLMNPNLYSHQFMDPIYYPLEMPVNAEPINLPKIELGQPLQDKKDCCHGGGGNGLTLADILAIIAALKGNGGMGMMNMGNGNQGMMANYMEGEYMDEHGNKIGDPPKKKRKIQIKDEEPRVKKDWWRVVRSWVNVYKFYSIGNKYGKHSNVRNHIVGDLTKGVYAHIESLKSWVMSIETLFWEEFKVFPNLNLSFNNYSGKLTIQEQSQKIMALINIFMRNLISKTSKGTEIPEKIQEILYKYIREKAYFPKKYLSTFEINRLDFNFYGGTKNVGDAQIGMITAFLILSRTVVQQIMMHPIENFEQFKTFPYIQLTCKYIGSILHYLTREAFRATPTMVKDVLALLNYYRNYHIYNEAVEKQQDYFNNNLAFKDYDELEENLVPLNTINEFFNLNQKWVEGIKRYIFQWAVTLGRYVRLKYQKFDKNLEKKELKKPSTEY